MTMTHAERLIIRERINLLLKQPFFGTLALKLRMAESADAPQQVLTMATDGTHLYYSAAFVESLKSEHLQFVLAHEVMHCALLHPFRRGNRDMLKWNVACDLAINQLLKDSGFSLLPGVLIDPQFKDMTAESIYAKLPNLPPPPQPQPGGKPDPARVGEVLDAPKPSDKGKDAEDSAEGQGDSDAQGQGQGQPMSESDWQIATSQAEKAAVAAGKMPGAIADSSRKARQAQTDWRAVLKRFIESTIPSDYSWSKPNRRMLSRGMILPGVKRENTGELVIAVDTSGSVPDWMLDQFASEITLLMSETRPSKVTVVYCDTRVYATREFECEETFAFEKRTARGGTNFQPVFDKTAELDIEPRALIYLTDLEPGDRPIDPGYPVLWAVPETCRTQQWPWGESVVIALDDKRQW